MCSAATSPSSFQSSSFLGSSGSEVAEVSSKSSDMDLEAAEVLTRYEGPRYRPFIASNEHGQKECYATLLSSPPIGSVLVATSCFEGLNQLNQRLKAGAKIDHVVILDCSPKVIAFWDFVEKTLPKSSSNWEFLDAISNWWEEHIHAYPCDQHKGAALSPLGCLAEEVSQKISWTSKRADFNQIKRFFSEKKVQVLQVDMSDSEKMSEIAKKIAGLGKVDHLYLSNVMEYIPMHSRETFLRNILSLISEDSIIVSTKPRTDKTTPLHQVAIMPKHRSDYLDPMRHLHLA